MGISAATVSWVWNAELIELGLTAPIMITMAVLIAGLFFHFVRERFTAAIGGLRRRMPLCIVAFIIVIILGLASSIISAIIASLILVEMIRALQLNRKIKVNLTIAACYAIGIGAALTPLGEPLSTIAISKLAGEPYNADFFFLVELLGVYVIPGVVGFAILSLFFVRKTEAEKKLHVEEAEVKESLKDVLLRALKVYVFVMALEFLGHGFKPIIDWYFVHIPGEALYWVNMVSAVLDNATLTAAEIDPILSLFQIKAALIALIISGGMLIPGNIPNIISANKLKITSKEWARLGVPIGIVTMAIYFAVIFFVPL